MAADDDFFVGSTVLFHGRLGGKVSGSLNQVGQMSDVTNGQPQSVHFGQPPVGVEVRWDGVA